jgi:hypothetical protein
MPEYLTLCGKRLCSRAKPLLELPILEIRFECLPHAGDDIFARENIFRGVWRFAGHCQSVIDDLSGAKFWHLILHSVNIYS